MIQSPRGVPTGYHGAMRAAVVVLCFVACSAAVAAPVPTNVLVNSSFEFGLVGWEPVWTREGGTAKVEVVTQGARDGKQALRLVHTGKQDWSLAQEAPLPANPNEVWEVSGWVASKGLEGNVQLGVILRDGQAAVMDWVFAPAETGTSHDWRRLRSRFMIPAGAASIQFRLTGSGPVDLLADDLALVRQPRSSVAPGPPLDLESTSLAVRVDGATGALTVTSDGITWTQSVGAPTPLVVTKAEKLSATAARLVLTDPVSDLSFTAQIALDLVGPGVAVTLSTDAEASMPGPLRYPYPFSSRPGDLVLVPHAEGLLIPVEETGETRGFDYFAWKTAMGFGGITDLGSGYALILAMPWDATLAMPVVDGRLSIGPVWHPQQGAFGYARRVVYWFEASGGHVALAKRHREHAKAMGWLVPFTVKEHVRPKISRLLGAVNLWFLDRDLPADFFEDLRSSGVDRAVVSVGGEWREPEDADARVRAIAHHDWLASRYDVYTDVWNPADRKPDRDARRDPGQDLPRSRREALARGGSSY